MSVAPSAGSSLTLRAFDQLRTDLICAQLRPGTRLRVQALSVRYGTGATAIREALSRLAAEGLVQFQDQRGFLAAPVSEAELVDLTEARIELESVTLARSMQRGDTAWEAEVLASYHRLSKCPPPILPERALQWSGEHRRFHAALLAGCGSDCLLRLCGLLYDQSERYRYLANLRTPPRAARRGNEHRELMQATLARDQANACRLLAAHYRRTTQIILRAPDCAALFATGVPDRPRARRSG